MTFLLEPLEGQLQNIESVVATNCSFIVELLEGLQSYHKRVEIACGVQELLAASSTAYEENMHKFSEGHNESNEVYFSLCRLFYTL